MPHHWVGVVAGPIPAKVNSARKVHLRERSSASYAGMEEQDRTSPQLSKFSNDDTGRVGFCSLTKLPRPPVNVLSTPEWTVFVRYAAAWSSMGWFRSVATTLALGDRERNSARVTYPVPAAVSGTRSGVRPDNRFARS